MALQLTSPAFEDGARIPEQCGYAERNVNPPLSVRGVPEGATSLALVVDDPDAVEPADKVWDHWVVWNVDPETTEIPEGWDAEGAGTVEGTNDYGERDYGGPNPPDREHSYRFELYALDSTLDLSPATDADGLREAVVGTILDDATLTGTDAP